MIVNTSCEVDSWQQRRCGWLVYNRVLIKRTLLIITSITLGMINTFYDCEILYKQPWTGRVMWHCMTKTGNQVDKMNSGINEFKALRLLSLDAKKISKDVLGLPRMPRKLPNASANLGYEERREKLQTPKLAASLSELCELCNSCSHPNALINP